MIKKLYNKYKDIIPYAFWGVCTTVVNTAAYWIAADLLKIPVVPSAVIAWFVAVLFAYLTNRKWVFHSQAVTQKEILKELIAFFGCRVATGVADWLCMFVFVDLLHFDDIFIKVAANVLVILLNYIASKWLIFKPKQSLEKEDRAC